MNELVRSLREIFSDHSGSFRGKVIGLYVILIAFNIAAWIWTVSRLSGHAVLLGAAVLAYTFGLRHALDADHIAAIDTTTRKLMQRNVRPTTVGLHFAVGHSLAVFTFVVAIAAWGAWGAGHGTFDFISSSTGLVSTLVSVSFLVVMAALNFTIAKGTYRSFRRVRGGGPYVEEDFEILLNKRGFCSRIFRPLFKLVNKSWHMIFIGFLFGLSFDTATEISLLGIAGAEAAKGLSVWVILVFPTLFAAGMSLTDATDGLLMVRAYGWAFRNPIRKLYYNLTITSISAAVALLVAGIEGTALLSAKFGLSGRGWDQVNALSSHWELTGIFVASLLIGSWILSVLLYRLKRYDSLELTAIPVRHSDA